LLNRSSLPKLLLLLAFFVFFSVSTVHFVESSDSAHWTPAHKNYRLDFDHVSKRGPYLNLKSALVVDYSNGQVLYALRPEQERPIASITKLMTAMVILDQGVDLKSTETITRRDAWRSSRSRLRVGYELTVGDLLVAALMNSDNRAARALARATCQSQEDFVVEMNRKARQLGLKHTRFVEPTGLDRHNVSTAHEIARMLHYAYDYPLIRKITSTRRARVRVVNRRRRWLQMANTNLLMHSPYKVLAGKTGFIRAADYCLATLLKDGDGRVLTVVVLGAPRDRLRFREARRLARWGFSRV